MTLHGVGVITKLYFAILRHLSNALNLAQRSSKVIDLGTYQLKMGIFIPINSL